MTNATQPSATSALQAAVRKLDRAKLNDWGMRLALDFTQYERDRRLAELKWARNARQFLGVYDPEIESGFDKQKSAAYPKLTRVKCVSMVSRLMNLLFPASDKNWTLGPTPVPNLDEEDLKMVLDHLQADPNKPVEDQIIEIAIQEFAKERARNLEREIEDQLQELGGSREVDYVALSRRVLYSGVVYGMGVLKGPFIREQQQRQWVRNDAGLVVPKKVSVFRPHFDFVPIWDYYPDLSAKYRPQMDGQFERMIFARHQLRDLADRDDFFGDVISDYLKNNAKGNYRRRTYESEIKSMGVQNNVNDQDGRKYEVLVWDGYVSAHDLASAGVDIPENQMDGQVEAIVWVLDGKVIKADINPWVTLDVDFKVHTYHHFVFEEDDSTLLGNGLPNIMRDSQMSVSAASRMLLDNASITCGPQLEINLDLVDMGLGQDLTSIRPYKVWYRRGTGADANVPAVKNVNIDSNMDELMKVIELFKGFADTETFVNAANGGDMSKGPSEPFRTATGASLLKGDAALPFKDVVRNFDSFTQSVLGSLVAFNRQFNKKPQIRGDFQVVPRGATSLIAKEVRGMALDNMAQTLTPDDKRYLNAYELLRERLLARDVDIGAVMCTKDEAAQRDDAAQQDAQAKSAQTDELIRAEVRNLLAQVVKNLSQADKNDAAADAAKANVLLDAIEKGALHHDGTGTDGGTGGAAAADPGAAVHDLPQPQRPADAGLASATGLPAPAMQ